MITSASAPASPTIALESCDGGIGNGLALALADLGATVLLVGSDTAALDRLRLAIAARWGRAVVAATGGAGDARIAIVDDVDAAIARLRGQSAATLPATEIVLIRSTRPDEAAALAQCLASLDPHRRAHTVALPAGVDDGSLDLAALAQTCGFLASACGRGLANLAITLRKDSARRTPAYPAMSACAPTIVPVG